MDKTAFLFPGQGSQTVGMGSDLYEQFDTVREIFDMAEEITRLKLTRLCFEGPMADLTLTVNLQPAVTAVNLACLAALNRHGVTPDISAGHSLGEFTALAAAGVVRREDALALVFKRGQLMHREAGRQQGAMKALVGLTMDEVSALVAVASRTGVVSVANHNTALQIVITGEPAAVESAAALAAEKGCRVVALKVSGAWHSSLIQGAEAEFKDYLDAVAFQAPSTPVLHNVTAAACNDPEQIRSLMARQLCAPVRWYDIIKSLMDQQVSVFVEVGPGKVLAGMLRKIFPKDYPAKIYNVSNMKTLEAFLHDHT